MTIVSHSAEKIQCLTNEFSNATRQFSLKINVKKTECLYQPVKLSNSQEAETVKIDGTPLTSCEELKYLGSIISTKNKKKIVQLFRNYKNGFGKR